MCRHCVDTNALSLYLQEALRKNVTAWALLVLGISTASMSLQVTVTSIACSDYDLIWNQVIAFEDATKFALLTPLFFLPKQLLLMILVAIRFLRFDDHKSQYKYIFVVIVNHS